METRCPQASSTAARAPCDDLWPKPTNPCTPSSCHIAEITSDCTDECLVLVCDDPTHPSADCHVVNGSTPCDNSCTTATDCSDCSGIDEFLQCCTDYHSYLAGHKHYDQLAGMDWDSSFSEMLCECTQGPPSVPIMHQSPSLESFYSTSSFPHSIRSFISDSSVSSSTSSSPSPSLPPFSLQTHAIPITSLPTAHSFPCMWANCDSAFSSLSELVGHVNLQHLRSPDSRDPHSGITIQSQENSQPLNQNTLSCHWGDCALYTSPSSIPGTSSVTSIDDPINVLTTHFMQDHLGLYHPFPSSTTVQGGLSGLQNTDSTPSVSRSEYPLHDCSGSHVCKWQSCTQSFSSCDDLTTHIASVHIRSGKAHYECFWEGCNRNGANGFASKQKISRHLQSHTGHRPFQCHVCNQNFSEAATLQQHMRRHTHERPYVCDFPGCGKAFSITGALTIHKRTHNGLRPFKCKYCDKAFSESSNLSKHLRTHTGVRPYVCTQEACKKAFARPDQLARHANVHRKKVP